MRTCMLAVIIVSYQACAGLVSVVTMQLRGQVAHRHVMPASGSSNVASPIQGCELACMA